MFYKEVENDNVNSTLEYKSDKSNSKSKKLFVYCINCGNKLSIDAKFCSECGSPVIEADEDDQDVNSYKEEPFGFGCEDNNTREADIFNHEESTLNKDNDNGNKDDDNGKTRKQEYAGKIYKCPSCGDNLPSLAAICPSCGHEINSAQLTESLREFIAQIDKYDRQIASDIDSPQKGWKSWGMGKKILWVFLNIITYCIPLAIYFALPLVRYNSTPPLTPIEKKRALLIKNFTFPNDRENIINALLFIKAKTAFLASETVNPKSVYWINTWITKTEHLYNKAQLLFPNDSVVENVYESIKNNHSVVQGAAKKRAIIGICIIVIAVVFFYLR